MPVRITTVFTLVLIHDFDDPLRRHVFVNAGGVVDVVVHVDHVELCPGDLVGGDVKHGDRMKIPQQQSFLLFGVGGRLVADLSWRRRLAGSVWAEAVATPIRNRVASFSCQAMEDSSGQVSKNSSVWPWQNESKSKES